MTTPGTTKPAPTYSDNQKLFIRAAKRAGLDVTSYSGRGMYGAECPAVSVRSVHDFKTRAKVSTDQLGLGYVVYCPR